MHCRRMQVLPTNSKMARPSAGRKWGVTTWTRLSSLPGSRPPTGLTGFELTPQVVVGEGHDGMPTLQNAARSGSAPGTRTAHATTNGDSRLVRARYKGPRL